jgi:hypothetical protein
MIMIANYYCDQNIEEVVVIADTVLQVSTLFLPGENEGNKKP